MLSVPRCFRKIALEILLGKDSIQLTHVQEWFPFSQMDRFYPKDHRRTAEIPHDPVKYDRDTQLGITPKLTPKALLDETWPIFSQPFRWIDIVQSSNMLESRS